jgi:hypothetical protein
VLDCSKQPSHARESANYIRGMKAHKTTPFIAYNVRAEDEATTKQRIPGAIVVSGDDPQPTLDALLAGPSDQSA